MKIETMAPGMYRIGDDEHFSNIRKGREYNGEQTSKWYADIRKSDGTLQRYAGIWNTRKEAVEEAIGLITKMNSTWVWER